MKIIPGSILQFIVINHWKGLLSNCPKICNFVCLSVCLSVCRSLCLSGWLVGWLFGCLTVCLSGCLSAWLSVCLAVWLSVCLAGWLSDCVSESKLIRPQQPILTNEVSNESSYSNECIAIICILIKLWENNKTIFSISIRPNRDTEFPLKTPNELTKIKTTVSLHYDRWLGG